MIITASRSIIPALDVDSIEALNKVVQATCSIKGIGGYKIGFELVIPFGMKNVVEAIRKYTLLPIIYDHQKAGTDVPFTGDRFAGVCKKEGVSAVILFPQAGPVTEIAWIKACLKIGLGVIIGGEMTHDGYLASDDGFIQDNAPDRIFTIAAKEGVTDFVVPGNKPDRIKHYKELLEKLNITPIFYSPGLISQGGDITKGAKAAGKNWHAIVGRAFYESDNVEQTAKELVKHIES